MPEENASGTTRMKCLIVREEKYVRITDVIRWLQASALNHEDIEQQDVIRTLTSNLINGLQVK